MYESRDKEYVCTYYLCLHKRSRRTATNISHTNICMYTKGSSFFYTYFFLPMRFNFKISLLPSISSLIGLDKPSSSSWRSSIIWFWGLLSFSLKKISFLQRVNPRKLAEIYFFVEAGRSIYNYY